MYIKFLKDSAGLKTRVKSEDITSRTCPDCHKVGLNQNIFVKLFCVRYFERLFRGILLSSGRELPIPLTA